jgi:PIN domain nuclease of toxin-antitoxin system
VTGVTLESSAVLTLVLQERGWQAVQAVLSKAEPAVLPSPGLTEVIYKAREKGNISTGPQIAQALAAQGLRFEMANEEDLVDAADLIEMSRTDPGTPPAAGKPPPTLSLGDALILAIAQRLGHRTVTRDAYWGELAARGLITVDVSTF